MKKSIISLFIFLALNSLLHGQTGVDVKAVGNASSVLEFPSAGTKGIILPAVVSLPQSPSNGTFLLDKNDKKVKVFQNGTWISLSEEGDVSLIVPYSGSEDNGKSSIMGAKTSNADGILVLESKTKALVLPRVSMPHLNVHSPYPGMMCYDTNRKALAVYDGSVWNYWN